MENIVLPRKFKNSENIVIKYVVIVHRGVRYAMNFIRLSHDGVTLDVYRDVFSENIERKRRPGQISKKWEVPVQPGGLESLTEKDFSRQAGISIEKWVSKKNER